MQVGDVLQLFAPSGHFTLQDSRKPLVLISGGVGITPTLPMLQAALPTGREITFIHCARDRGVHAFREKIDALVDANAQLTRRYCYEQAGDGMDLHGRLSTDVLAQWLPASRDADVYFLGPVGFMRSVKQSLQELKVPEAQVHYEFFGPAQALV